MIGYPGLKPGSYSADPIGTTIVSLNAQTLTSIPGAHCPPNDEAAALEPFGNGIVSTEEKK